MRAELVSDFFNDGGIAYLRCIERYGSNKFWITDVSLAVVDIGDELVAKSSSGYFVSDSRSHGADFKLTSLATLRGISWQYP